MTTRAYWAERARMPRFGRLDKNIVVDVAVIGGGITGVTTAYRLSKAGFSVALLERDRFGSGDTGQTTAHLTYVTDVRLTELARDFGKDHAQAAWDAGRAAIEQAHDLVHTEEIDCDFGWVPAFLHAPTGSADRKESRSLLADAELANELGFEAKLLAAIPFMGTAGVQFPNQAKFHPLKYLAGLLKGMPRKCRVFERSEVSEVQENPLVVKVNEHEVHCGYLVIATHVPLTGIKSVLRAAIFQTKLAPYSTYAIGARAPKNSAPEALFWDTNDPYRYLRVDRHARHDYVIYGGEDHKTGQKKNPEECFERLERALGHLVPNAELTHRWSGQVIETADGLPFIGEVTEKQFVATGFAGNGTTFGTLAASMAADAVAGRKNPWTDLFSPGRTKVLAGAWDYIKENIDYPYYLIRDRLRGAEATSLRSLKRGQGKIIRLHGERVAAYRDDHGKVTTVSPVCTHLGCQVHWNDAERSWDCPCHGSRFEPSGAVIAGPAESPLERIELKDK